jgi:hypothetical protein
MPIKRLTAVLVALVFLGATPKKKAADVPPVKVPDKLQPYVELSRLCSEYEKQVTVVQWREVWRQTFDAATAEKWVTPPAPAADPNLPNAPVAPRRATPIVTAERIDDRDCAVLDATDIQNAYLPVGNGPVRGEFAIEFVGKAMSDRRCDLSIACLQGGQQGPSFEFGAHWNQGNFLRANIDGQIQRTSIGREPLIELDHWYTIRLEVRNGKTTASIDGKVIKSLDCSIDTDRAWTPNIYIYQSKIAVDEVHVEAMAPSASGIGPAEAFAKVFGERSRDKVMADIRQLVDALDDGDYRVREAAHSLLKPMGTITREALQGAIDAGSAEQMSRAQQLMDLLPPPTTRPAN